VEVAKETTSGTCKFHSSNEFLKITELYGSMKKLQTMGEQVS
jgi:Protein of unknown function (DUF1177)